MKPSTSKLIQCFALFLALMYAGTSYAQEEALADMTLDELSAELDELFSDESDSMSLFSLIDSILKVDDSQTSLSFRFGYSSRVTSAGRDFGIDQQGLNPGVSLYHKTGLYADVTGFWNSEFDPKYNLTVATLGYLGNVGTRWSYSFSYDHSFFHSTDELQEFPVNNSVGASATLDFKFVYTGLDYNFAFGTETAQRLAWNLTGYIRKKAFGPFTSVTFLPTFTILFGNQASTQSYFNVDRLIQIKNANLAELNRIAENSELTLAELIQIRIATNRDNLTERQKQRIKQALTTIEDIETFGLMNYYLSFPVSFSSSNWNILLSYNYNIPVELSGSEYESSSNGYFSCTVAYNLSLK